jgi:hypothetical protein
LDAIDLARRWSNPRSDRGGSVLRRHSRGAEHNEA